MKNNMYLNLSLTFLFACLMASPSFAQWTDNGTNMVTDDNINIGNNGHLDIYSLYVRKNKAGWQGRFANRNGVGADVYLAHGNGYGMNVIGRTTDDKYTLRLASGNTTFGQNTHVFYNDGRAALGLLGNVGVGTTDPGSKLTVVSSGNQSGISSYSDNGASHFPWTNGWSYLSGKGLIFRTDGATEQMRINPSGNVGIGTNNPNVNHKLTVESGDGGGLFISNSNGNSHFPWTNGWSYLSGKGLIFRTDGNTERMRVTSSGNVGIGTTTPANKLDVNGTIRAKEIIVEEGWGDYVFYDDYNLPTLEEEEKHIEENGHLSGFESAEDMVGEIQLGDVTKKQQVKIEEVILHLIEMKKEIKQLKEENKQLKAQINKK